ncbi:MAG: hypothetical protein QM749_00440 [Aquabacterium sp.]
MAEITIKQRGWQQVITWAKAYVENETCIQEASPEQLSQDELDGVAILAGHPEAPQTARKDELGYASRLAEIMYRRFYPEHAQLRLLPDLIGVLTQIDSMTSGLVRPEATQVVQPTPEEWREALQYAVDIHTPGRTDGPSDLHIARMLRLADKALKTQPAQPATLGELPIDEVLSLADLHADESHEDGRRVIDRGGLMQLAKDIVRRASASAAGGDGVDPIHLYDLRYAMNVLHKVRAMVSDQDAAHGEIGAAINGIRYVIDRAEAARAPSPATPVGEGYKWIDSVLLDVAELPDRTSPEDQPDMMLVTADELRAIIQAHAKSPSTQAVPTGELYDLAPSAALQLANLDADEQGLDRAKYWEKFGVWYINRMDAVFMHIAGSPKGADALDVDQSEDNLIRAIGNALLSAHDHLEMQQLERSHCNSTARIREGLAAFSAYKKRTDFGATQPPQDTPIAPVVEKHCPVTKVPCQACTDTCVAQKAQDKPSADHVVLMGDHIVGSRGQIITHGRGATQAEINWVFGKGEDITPTGRGITVTRRKGDAA